MIHLTLYSRPGCHLCEEMKAVINRLAADSPLALTEIDISTDPDLEAVTGQVDTLVRTLHAGVVRARLAPIHDLFDRFPRVVRDLGATLGKARGRGQVDMEQEVRGVVRKGRQHRLDRVVVARDPRIRPGAPREDLVIRRDIGPQRASEQLVRVEPVEGFAIEASANGQPLRFLQNGSAVGTMNWVVPGGRDAASKSRTIPRVGSVITLIQAGTPAANARSSAGRI